MKERGGEKEKGGGGDESGGDEEQSGDMIVDLRISQIRSRVAAVC